jgi:Protein of unknown function (DUF3828)
MRVRRLVLLFAMAVCASSRFAPAQDADSARTFVESLYKLYTKGGEGVPLSRPHESRYYHSSLLALMRADEKAVGPGDVGAIDGDPVCGCQDWEGIWNLHIDIQLQSPDRAVADASFALSAPAHGGSQDARRIIMTLVPENGKWRIWDVRDDSDPKHPFDVREALGQEIQKLTKSPKNKPPR